MNWSPTCQFGGDINGPSPGVCGKPALIGLTWRTSAQVWRRSVCGIHLAPMRVTIRRQPGIVQRHETRLVKPS